MPFFFLLKSILIPAFLLSTPTGSMNQIERKQQLNAHIYQKYARQYIIQRIPLENRILTINNKQYHFEEKLGRGTFGTVYVAHLLPYNTPFAVKVLSLVTNNDKEAKTIAVSCSTEIAMAKRLATTSKDVVKVYDHDYDPHLGLLYIVMELGEQDLEHVLSKRFSLWRAERKLMWRQLVEIGVTLHSQKIINRLSKISLLYFRYSAKVHRDTKPSNLVLFPGNVIKLVDFGIAQENQQKSIGRNGSPPYTAPEITLGSKYDLTKVTTKADVWPLAAVFNRMTYMTKPSYHPPCYRHPVNKQPTNDPHLVDVLRRALVRNPERRPNALWFVQHQYTRTP